MSELSSLFEQQVSGLEAELAGPRLDDAGRARVVRRVRRVRRVDTARITGVVALVVAALGAGSWGLRDLVERPVIATPPEPTNVTTPSVTPTPSATPSVSTTPSPEPSTGPDGRAMPGFVTAAAGLPSALPLPDGLLEQTVPGWVVATYEPMKAYANTPYPFEKKVGREEHQIVYLVSPVGTRYQVLELPATTPLEVVAWTAGASTALVRDFAATAGSAQIQRLDLHTGVLTATDLAVDQVGARGVPSPSGRRLLVGGASVFDVGGQTTSALPRLPEDRKYEKCQAIGWYDEDSVIVSCGIHDPAFANLETDNGQDPRVLVVALDGSGIQKELASDPGGPLVATGPAYRVGDTVVSLASTTEPGRPTCNGDPVVLRGGKTVLIDVPTASAAFGWDGYQVLGANADVVIFHAYGSCSGGGPLAGEVFAFDGRTSSTRVLIPPPVDSADPDAVWELGMLSAVVGS